MNVCYTQAQMTDKPITARGGSRYVVAHQRCGVWGNFAVLLHWKWYFLHQPARAKGGRKPGETIATEQQLDAWWKVSISEWMLHIQKKLQRKSKKESDRWQGQTQITMTKYNYNCNLKAVTVGRYSVIIPIWYNHQSKINVEALESDGQQITVSIAVSFHPLT